MSHAMLIVSASKGQHALTIAGCITAALRSCGIVAVPAYAGPGMTPVEPGQYCGTVLLASAHEGRLERDLVSFARANRTILGCMATTLIFSSPAQAVLDGQKASAEQRSEARTEVRRTGERFVSESGVRPTHVLPVASVGAQGRYSLIERWLGAASRPQEYGPTDWTLLDAFVRQVACKALCAPSPRDLRSPRYAATA